LVAYQGERGFFTLALLESDSCDIDEAPLVEDSLVLLFGDRTIARAADRRIHKALDLRFRGKGAWPAFRSLKPGYMGATLNSMEAQVLATCLEQTVAFVTEILSGIPLPPLPGSDWLLAREMGADGEWRTAPALMPEPHSPPELQVDAPRVGIALASLQRTDQTWELKQLAIGPVRGEDSERTPVGRVLLCVERESGTIFPGSVMGPDDSLQEALLESAETAGLLPAVLAMTSEYLAVQLQPLAIELGVELRLVVQLREAERAAEALKAALGGGR
jgi:hypothetical protein